MKIDKQVGIRNKSKLYITSANKDKFQMNKKM